MLCIRTADSQQTKHSNCHIFSKTRRNWKFTYQNGEYFGPVTLKSNKHLGKISPVDWEAGTTQQRANASDTLKLPEELEELLNRSSEVIFQVVR